MTNGVAAPIEPQNPTGGYGQREAADDTRQAQQTVSNDAPTDINFNALATREQGGTLILMGKNFEANANRLNILANHFAGLIQAANVKPT